MKQGLSYILPNSLKDLTLRYTYFREVETDICFKRLHFAISKARLPPSGLRRVWVVGDFKDWQMKFARWNWKIWAKEDDESDTAGALKAIRKFTNRLSQLGMNAESGGEWLMSDLSVERSALRFFPTKRVDWHSVAPPTLPQWNTEAEPTEATTNS